jgi:RNA polymerase sigma factor (sigma-70 family)
MSDNDRLAEEFEANRSQLRAVAYRMLSSLAEADDAVQEAWLRLNRSGGEGIDNLAAWLTTVVSRVCLDMLRSRTRRREDPLTLAAAADHTAGAGAGAGDSTDPEQEAVLADSVGLALLVVLETLTPAERVAFVLHDSFALPFDDIAPILGRSPVATRQLASRARRRVQGRTVPHPDVHRQREAVEAYLAAARTGNLDALLAVLDPDVVTRADTTAAAAGAVSELRGATAVAEQALTYGARFAEAALLDGSVGIVVALRGRLLLAIAVTVVDDRITAMEVMAEPERLERLDLAVLDA